MVTAEPAGPRETRSQTTPRAEEGLEAHMKRTQSEGIQHEINKLRDLYG